MPELIRCPNCNRQLRVPEELIGKTVKCPDCAAQFTALIGGATSVETSPWAQAAGPKRGASEGTPEEAHEWEVEEPRRGRRYEPHRGTLILVLGILGLVICGPILGPMAWVMGSGDLKKIRAGVMDPSGRDLTNAGRICGIIATCLALAGCVIWSIWLVAFAAMAGGGAMR